MTVFTDLLVNTDIVEVAATALKIANKSWPASKPPNSAGSFYAFFGNVQHSMTCEKGAACTFHATPQFLQAARTSLERFGIPTLIALQEDVGAGGKYLDLWTSLAKLLGITKEAVRQRYRLDRKCCNLTCPARNSGTHTARKSLCSECESVYYCDRTCQKRYAIILAVRMLLTVLILATGPTTRASVRYSRKLPGSTRRTAHDKGRSLIQIYVLQAKTR